MAEIYAAPLAQLESEGLAAALESARTADPGQVVEIALRREKGAISLVLALADLAGLASLEEVTFALSDFADRALEVALAEVMADRGAEPRGFAIIALGKHGSRELNYSSDIDLLFLFDPTTLPLRPREEPGQAAVRIGQRLVEILQKRTAEGYVFRVDLRLRPSSEITPVALPVDAAISYYESSALAWERAAFIRARHVAGDAALGRYFLDAVHPFVWRRSVDFGAVGEIRAISGRIRSHYATGQVLGPGFDLKRGRGGIREIEFFAQILQLIHGGRDPELRAPATLDALAALADAGHMEPGEAEILGTAYRLLRTVEHRLQMIDDRQTHSLPADSPALDAVARLHGMESGAELITALAGPVEAVGTLYDRLGEQEKTRLPLSETALDLWLEEAGYDDVAGARARIAGWRSGKARALRSPAAREAFETMLPGLLISFGRGPEPARTINRFDDLVARLPSGVNFFRLIDARPGLADHVAAILSHAPLLADQLGRRPDLLEGLIDATAFEPLPPIADLIGELDAPERESEDYQMLLDRVRRRVNERRFALGVQLIAARRDPLEVARDQSYLAEAAIGVLAAAASAEFERVHGRIPGGGLLILALGRLGGEALTNASDLDLVYLFEGPLDRQSDGSRPLRATDYFNRLAPRITAALSVATAAGPLYPVDTRLRPSGADGMLAVSLESFADYQREKAWTWEHMALARARPVFGSAEGRASLSAVIDEVLRIDRDRAALIEDVSRMRAEMARHKPPAGTLDVKLGDGGLVDLEFAVHTLQLASHVGLDPHLEIALAALAVAGLAPPEADPALRLLTRMLIMQRLLAPGAAEPAEASRPLFAAACGLQDWDALLAAHGEARQSVADFWGRVRGREGE